MMRCFLVTVGLSLLSGTGRAGEAVFVPVHGVDKATGALLFRELEEVRGVKDFVVEEIVDGKTVQRTVQGHTVRFVEKSVKLHLKYFKVYDGFGNLLAAKEVMKRVKPGTVVLVARMGDKLNRWDLFSLTKETMVLVMPPNRWMPKPAPDQSSLVFLTMVEEAMMLGVEVAGHFVGE